LTLDVPLSTNKLTEAAMLADAKRTILESHDFVKAQDIAGNSPTTRYNQKFPIFPGLLTLPKENRSVPRSSQSLKPLQAGL
jgi:hypothetical protein